MKATVLISLIAAALAALGLTAATAQYPAPQGSCSVSAGSATAPANTTISFTVTVLTGDGAPAAGVQGVASIISQPGSGATIVNPNYTTGADGKAVIQVQSGDTAGQITLGVTCGTLSASSIVSVVAGVTAPTPKPPVTGDGASAGGSDAPMAWGLAGALAVIVAGAGAGAITFARRRG